MSQHRSSTPAQSCESCASCDCRPGRRSFLRTTAGALLSLVGLAGVPAIGHARGLLARSRREERTFPIPGEDGATIDERDEVILVRWAGAVYALSLACPHQNTALRWLAADARFQCPKHKSKYRPDGSFIEGRATRGMDRFAVRREGQTVIVRLDTLYNAAENPAGWTGAVVMLGSSPHTP